MPRKRPVTKLFQNVVSKRQTQHMGEKITIEENIKIEEARVPLLQSLTSDKIQPTKATTLSPALTDDTFRSHARVRRGSRRRVRVCRPSPSKLPPSGVPLLPCKPRVHRVGLRDLAELILGILLPLLCRSLGLRSRPHARLVLGDVALPRRRPRRLLRRLLRLLRRLLARLLSRA